MSHCLIYHIRRQRARPCLLLSVLLVDVMISNYSNCVMTTSHLVLVSSQVAASLLTRLHPLPHPPEVGGGDGQAQVDVRVLVQVQLLQVLRGHREDLHGLLLGHHEVGPLPVEAVQGATSRRCGGGSDQGTQGAGTVSSRVQLVFCHHLRPSQRLPGLWLGRRLPLALRAESQESGNCLPWYECVLIRYLEIF